MPYALLLCSLAAFINQSQAALLPHERNPTNETPPHHAYGFSYPYHGDQYYVVNYDVALSERSPSTPDSQ